MSLVGGATVKDFVSRTMGKLLHPELAWRFVRAWRLTKTCVHSSWNSSVLWGQSIHIY